MLLEEFMRLGLCLLVSALAVAGCDRASAPAEQGTPASPDEVVADAAPALPVKTIDRSHKGEPAPAHSFVGADGKTVSLRAFKGRPVLVNLWATWCGPCVKELPTLDALAKTGVAVVALSQDSDDAKARAFLKDKGLAALQGYTDSRMQWLGSVATNLPTTLLYDSQGREVWRFLGDLDWTGPVATKALAEAR